MCLGVHHLSGATCFTTSCTPGDDFTTATLPPKIIRFFFTTSCEYSSYIRSDCFGATYFVSRIVYLHTATFRIFIDHEIRVRRFHSLAACCISFIKRNVPATSLLLYINHLTTAAHLFATLERFAVTTSGINVSTFIDDSGATSL